MTKLRLTILWAGAVLALLVMNGLIVQKELVVAAGQTILLELAPRDPRSLMQGDYMVLNYALARDARAPLPPTGALVLQVDAQNIATFVRVHTPATPLAANEVLLSYRLRAGSLRFGAESFFFQEGQASHYAQARYAELRVAASGESVLVGLRGPSLEPLGP